eukprot:scaffold128216_cov66-Phaeocystis_antarctica.AAC.2
MGGESTHIGRVVVFSAIHTRPHGHTVVRAGRLVVCRVAKHGERAARAVELHGLRADLWLLRMVQVEDAECGMVHRDSLARVGAYSDVFFSTIESCEARIRRRGTLHAGRWGHSGRGLTGVATLSAPVGPASGCCRVASTLRHSRSWGTSSLAGSWPASAPLRRWRSMCCRCSCCGRRRGSRTCHRMSPTGGSKILSPQKRPARVCPCLCRYRCTENAWPWAGSAVGG